MAVVPRRRKRKVVFFVVNRIGKRPIWERVGTDRRQAERRDAEMKKEIAAGTYNQIRTGAVTVEREGEAFFEHRKVRTVEDERRNFENHVLKRCQWFAALKLGDVRPSHTAKLVDDLELPYENDEGEMRTLASKTIANIIGMLHTLFQEAVLHDRIPANPIILKRGRLKRSPKHPRAPYSLADMKRILLSDAPVDARVWGALALYTGMREGEVCGRRWRDWDPNSAPLGCLSVRTQYDDQPLKTEMPRQVPVHAGLARILQWWWDHGWELVHCRKPKPEDWIIPSRVLAGPHTRSSAYKMWRRALESSGVANLSLHSTRHSFITWARRRGADKDILEAVTHNAKGDIIDQYTHWDWDPLCAQVARFPDPLVDEMLDRFTNPAK